VALRRAASVTRPGFAGGGLGRWETRKNAGHKNMSDRKLASYFTNENPRKVWCLVDDAPEWLKDAVHAAHNDDMPNDWIYEECRAICDAIDCNDNDLAECGEDDHNLHEYADGRVDIYTKVLYQWQADMCHTDCYSYAETALADSGSETATGEKRVQILQYEVIRAIAACILNAWREDADNAGEEDES
jgi:hypothetical protein